MTKCAATTKSGKPCSRNAKDGSDYCSQHGAMEAVTETVAKTVTAAASSVEDAAAAKKAEADAIKEALGELNQRVDEIKSKSPKFSPSDFSPEKLLGWIKDNLANFKLPVVEELKEKLSQATAEDFKNETCAVKYLRIPFAFKVTLLDGRQGVIDDDQPRVELFDQVGEFLNFAAAK